MLYLDTEWADPGGRQLISLAIVADEGEEFYAERADLPANATMFVEHEVYPLLDRGAAVLVDLDFAVALRRFIGRFDAPEIVYDFPNDLALLIVALNGFDHISRRDLDAGALLPRYRPRLFSDPTAGILLDDPCDAFFAMHPEGKRHHALWDARALRYAAHRRSDPQSRFLDPRSVR